MSTEDVVDILARIYLSTEEEEGKESEKKTGQGQVVQQEAQLPDKASNAKLADNQPVKISFQLEDDPDTTVTLIARGPTTAKEG